MIYAYLIFDLLCFGIGRTVYKNYFNPVCLYALVWGVALLTHQSGFIVFYELQWYTWALIFGTQFLFTTVNLFFMRVTEKQKTDTLYKKTDLRLQKKYIKIYILVTCFLAGIAVVYNYIAFARVYGFNLLSAINQIYADRVNQAVQIRTIPYLGALTFVSIPLCGIYTKRFGFSLLLLFPFILEAMKALTTGGRAGLIFIMILFVASYFSATSPARKKLQWQKKVLLSVGVCAIAGVVAVMTFTRTSGASIPFASPLYKKVFGDNAFLYKVFQYIGAPIGTLNEYLKTCEFHFGQNSFLPVYNFLSNLGLCERIEQYQEFFNTPVPCNVGTWIRELIEDFTIPGALAAILLFSFVCAYFYYKAKQYDSVKSQIIWSVFALFIALSFFDWTLRSADMWIALFFGYVIGWRIDRLSSVVGKTDRFESSCPDLPD